jgi:hypothetical protein
LGLTGGLPPIDGGAEADRSPAITRSAHRHLREPAYRKDRPVSAFATAAPGRLTNADRCDRCGAQAFVRTTMSSGHELLWCAHHFAENEQGLAAKNAAVTADLRHTIGASRAA